MTRRVLVTGASGFVGRSLLPVLLERGFEVHGLDLHLGGGLPAGCREIQADMSDPGAFTSLDPEWDWVIHLAGATLPSRFTSPAPLMLNLGITVNLLEHLRRARVLLVSSCHVYAPSSDLRTERSPLAPQGLYGLSKLFVEQLAPHYLRKLDIRIARPFNHLGPGSPPSLVVPSILERLERAPDDPSFPIEMQGRDSFRDFIDVRDVTEAYLAILGADDPGPGVFNVCTGRPVRISEVVGKAMGLMGLRHPVVFTGNNNSKDDNDIIVGDPALLTATTGWRSRFSLESSLATMIQHRSNKGDN